MINDEDIKNIFGCALKELRIKKGLTQEKLAEFIDMQPQTIAKIESGKRFVSSELLAKLCNYFNAEPYLFFLKSAQTYTPESIDHIAKIDKKLSEIYKIIKTQQ